MALASLTRRCEVELQLAKDMIDKRVASISSMLPKKRGHSFRGDRVDNPAVLGGQLLRTRERVSHEDFLAHFMPALTDALQHLGVE